MQGVHGYRLRSDGGVRLELTPTTTSPLAIDISESTEMRIQRLISENPVIIFSRSACCMCHVMRRLFSSVGVHPTVIELEEDEIGALSASQQDGGCGGDCGSGGVHRRDAYWRIRESRRTPFERSPCSQARRSWCSGVVASNPKQEGCYGNL